jgi:hypothetical protein
MRPSSRVRVSIEILPKESDVVRHKLGSASVCGNIDGGSVPGYRSIQEWGYLGYVEAFRPEAKEGAKEVDTLLFPCRDEVHKNYVDSRPHDLENLLLPPVNLASPVLPGVYRMPRSASLAGGRGEPMEDYRVRYGPG